MYRLVLAIITVLATMGVLFFSVQSDGVITIYPDDPNPIDTTVVDPPEPPSLLIEGNEKVKVDFDDNYNGFRPHRFMLQNHTGQRSWASVELPPNPDPNAPDVKIITDQEGSWEAAGVNNPKYTAFLITPGNYDSFGVLEIHNSGTAEQPLIFQYYDPEYGFEPYHAFDLTVNQNRGAVIEGLTIGDRTTPANHIFIIQLSFIGDDREKDGVKYGQGSFITPGSSHIVIDYCYAYRSKGWRMYASNSSFQNNVDAGRVPVRGDIGGVGFYTTEEHASTNNLIVGNEIDHTDGIGLPRDGENELLFKNTDGTWIVDNDIYNGSDVTYEVTVDGVIQYRTCGGEAIDTKNGSSDPNNPVIFAFNRIWNLWPTPSSEDGIVTCGDNTGSPGGGGVIHKFFENGFYYGNIVFFSSNGLDVQGTSGEKVTNQIAVVNNLFFDLRKYKLVSPSGRIGYTGRGLRLNGDNSDAYLNSFVNTDVGITIDRGNRVDRDVIGNTFFRVPNVIEATAGLSQVSVEYNNEQQPGAVQMTDLKIMIQRWTNPQVYTLEKAVPHIDAQFPPTLEYDLQSQIASEWWGEYQNWPFFQLLRKVESNLQ